MSNIGFIGLGIMGRPMAGHLLAGGHTLFVHDIAPVAQAVLDAGATGCANGAEVARHADIIITMVPDTPHVEAALFGSPKKRKNSESGDSTRLVPGPRCSAPAAWRRACPPARSSWT